MAPERRSSPLFDFAYIFTFLLRLIFAFIEFIIALRFILRFLGANPANNLVAWVYETSFPLVAPFTNIFPNPVISGRFVIEFSSLLAMLVYAFIAYLINELIDYIAYLGSTKDV